jgi:hypothetical protein
MTEQDSPICWAWGIQPHDPFGKELCSCPYRRELKPKNLGEKISHLFLGESIIHCAKPLDASIESTIKCAEARKYYKKYT